jgi:hypothetical protein
MSGASPIVFLGKEVKMLFNFDGKMVDIVREAPYKGVYTVRASSGRALRKFRQSSPADMVRVPHHLYPFIIHIDMNSCPLRISAFDFKKVEVVDRLTPEPVCFVYDYAYYDEEGQIQGDYDYCWPQEKDQVFQNLLSSEKDMVSEPAFLPLFRIPRELVGAPYIPMSGEIELKSWDEIDEEKPDNE